jgi:hypothetical protein
VEWELTEMGLNLSERVSIGRRRTGHMNNEYVASHKWPMDRLKCKRVR